MSESSIIKLSKTPAIFGNVTENLDAGMFESAKPSQHKYSYYKDETLGLYVGVLDSTDMTEIAKPYAHDEFMFIIEGAVDIKNNITGKIETIMAGESCVIPRGYDCQLHQQGCVRKFYVIYESSQALEKSVTDNVVYINENKNMPWKNTSDGHRKKTLYQNNNQRFTAGVWESNTFTTGLIDFPYHEFILINKGNLICTDKQGVAHYFKSGDALFIPQGTHCAWQVKKNVSIYFAQIK